MRIDPVVLVLSLLFVAAFAVGLCAFIYVVQGDTWGVCRGGLMGSNVTGLWRHGGHIIRCFDGSAVGQVR